MLTYGQIMLSAVTDTRGGCCNSGCYNKLPPAGDSGDTCRRRRDDVRR